MDWALGVDVETGGQLRSHYLEEKRQCRWVVGLLINTLAGVCGHDPWHEQEMPSQEQASLRAELEQAKLE